MYQVFSITEFISKKKDPNGVKYYNVKCALVVNGRPDLNYQFSVFVRNVDFGVDDLVIPLICPASDQGSYKVTGILKI